VCGVALNRPSYQSSVYTVDGLEHGAGVGNDGRHSAGQDFVMSDSETEPWWTVELREAMTVTRLYLTNVDDHGTPGVFWLIACRVEYRGPTDRVSN